MDIKTHLLLNKLLNFTVISLTNINIRLSDSHCPGIPAYFVGLVTLNFLSNLHMLSYVH